MRRFCNLTPQYRLPLNICGGRGERCGGRDRAAARISLPAPAIPAAVMSSVVTGTRSAASTAITRSCPARTLTLKQQILEIQLRLSREPDLPVPRAAAEEHPDRHDWVRPGSFWLLTTKLRQNSRCQDTKLISIVWMKYLTVR